QGHRPDGRILIAERETNLLLIRREKIESLKIQNISPAARHLAIGNLEHVGRQAGRELRNGLTIEDAVAKIREDDNINLVVRERILELFENLIGDWTIVQLIDFEHSIAARDINALLRCRTRMVDNRLNSYTLRGQVFQHEILQRVVAQDGREFDVRTGFA